MNPVYSTCVPRVGNLGAFLAAAIVLVVGCGGGGTDTGESASSSGTGGSATETPGTTAEPTTAEPTTAEPTTGSSGEEPTTGPAAVTYADVQAIWTARCTGFCHEPGGGGQIQVMLDLTPAVSYAQIVDVQSIGAPALSRVVAGDLESSYLWHKLKNTQLDVNGAGFQMPAGGLPPDDVATIEAWIEGGALP